MSDAIINRYRFRCFIEGKIAPASIFLLSFLRGFMRTQLNIANEFVPGLVVSFINFLSRT